MGKQLSLAGHLPAKRSTQRFQVDRSNDESALTREIRIEGARELRGRRHMNETIGQIERRAGECARIKRGPLSGCQNLVRDRVAHPSGWYLATPSGG